MKKALVNTVCDLMQENPNIYMFTADLGYGVMDRLAGEHPDRFINVGICEQNMTSVAAGMALEGNIVFTYSIGNFPTLRCLEQIRNDIAYHHANVKIVAVGGGFAYGSLGMSHHATEDIAVMRAIPGMVIFSPADCMETTEAVKEAVKIDGPVYIRLGHGGEKDIRHESTDITQVMRVNQSKSVPGACKVAILGHGIIMPEAESAIELLSGDLNVAAYSVAKLKPIDEKHLVAICNEYDAVVTVEEHNIIGGLGSAVAELIAEHNLNCRFMRMGMKDSFTQAVGSSEYLRMFYGLDRHSICENVRRLCGDVNEKGNYNCS